MIRKATIRNHGREICGFLHSANDLLTYALAFSKLLKSTLQNEHSYLKLDNSEFFETFMYYLVRYTT